MKLKTALTVLAIAAMSAVSAPASWANSLTDDGVTFTLTDNGSGSLTFTIDNALNATYDGVGEDRGWEDINFINNFSLKSIGGDSMLLTSWTVNSLELNGIGGCDGGDSGGFCFTHDGGPLALTNNMVFDITYTGTLDMTAPHLKVFFMEFADQQKCSGPPGNQTCLPKATGSLLSATVPGTSVPEPASLMLLGAGLAGLGIWRRKSTKV